MQDSIFISFSGDETEKIAKIILIILDDLYVDKNIDIFLAERSISKGDNFDIKIQEKLKSAKSGICIFSPENTFLIDDKPIVSSWLLYEAGALSITTDINKGTLQYYFFCLDNEHFPDPVSRINHSVFNPDSSNGINQNEFLKMLNEINESLNANNKLDYWSLLEKITNKTKKKLFLRFKEVSRNFDRIQEFESVQKTKLANNAEPKKVEEIPEYLKKMTYGVPSDWMFSEHQFDLAFSKKILVNGTKITNYVVFTDSNRVLTIDNNYKQNQSIENQIFLDAFDDFFIERILSHKENKEKFKEFLDCDIEKVEKIPGIVIEDNSSLKNFETHIMLGLCVYLKPESLDIIQKVSNCHSFLIYKAIDLYTQYRDIASSRALMGAEYILGVDRMYFSIQAN